VPPRELNRKISLDSHSESVYEKESMLIYLMKQIWVDTRFTGRLVLEWNQGGLAGVSKTEKLK
jgi:hypothetical protein